MQEKIFYTSPDIVLTSANLICNGESYGLDTITKVDIRQERGQFALIIFAGAILLAISSVYSSNWGGFIGLALPIIAGGLLYKAYIDEVYTVQVDFNTGIRIMLNVKEKSDCFELAEALHRYSTVPTTYQIA